MKAAILVVAVGVWFRSGRYRIAKRCSMPTSLKTLSSAVMYRASIDGRVLFRRVPVRSIARSGAGRLQ